MYTFTTDQLALLLEDHTRAKLLVEIATGTLRYCTGLDDYEYSGDWYSSRAINIDEVTHGELGASVSLTFDDTDKELRTSNFSTPIGGSAVSWYFFLREPETDWVLVAVLDWLTRDCGWTGSQFTLELSGSSGFRRRAGLFQFSRLCDLKFGGTLCGYAGALKTCSGTYADCQTRGRTTQFRGLRWCPEPGETLILPNGSNTFNSPPGENDSPFDPGVFQSTITQQPLRSGGRIAPIDSSQAGILGGGTGRDPRRST